MRFDGRDQSSHWLCLLVFISFLGCDSENAIEIGSLETPSDLEPEPELPAGCAEPSQISTLIDLTSAVWVGASSDATRFLALSHTQDNLLHFRASSGPAPLSPDFLLDGQDLSPYTPKSAFAKNSDWVAEISAANQASTPETTHRPRLRIFNPSTGASCVYWFPEPVLGLGMGGAFEGRLRVLANSEGTEFTAFFPAGTPLPDGTHSISGTSVLYQSFNQNCVPLNAPIDSGFIDNYSFTSILIPVTPLSTQEKIAVLSGNPDRVRLVDPVANSVLMEYNPVDWIESPKISDDGSVLSLILTTMTGQKRIAWLRVDANGSTTLIAEYSISNSSLGTGSSWACKQFLAPNKSVTLLLCNEYNVQTGFGSGFYQIYNLSPLQFVTPSQNGMVYRGTYVHFSPNESRILIQDYPSVAYPQNYRSRVIEKVGDVWSEQYCSANRAPAIGLFDNYWIGVETNYPALRLERVDL